MGMLDRLRVVTEGRTPVGREIRDPSAATTSLRYHSPGMPLVPEWNADQAIRLGYLANVIAYRCVQIIADTGAAKPFRAGAAAPEAAGGKAEHNPQARLAGLLGPPPGGPAPKLSARKLWRWTIAQRVVTGRNGWEIELDGERIVAFWPLTSSNLNAIPSDGGADWFRTFTYGRPDNAVLLSPDRVHYGWTPHPKDFRQPLSPLASARYDLSIALAADRHSLSFMQNNAVPAHVVVMEEFGTKEDFEAFKRQWQSEYRGDTNAGKTHFVEADPDSDAPLSESIFIQTLGVSAKDARLIEQHQATLERVAMSLGVPWSKLDTSGRTYENADAEDAWFWESTMAPLLSDLADEVNMDLAPRLGGEVGWFDLSDVRALQPRPAADASAIPGLILAGVCTRAEARPWLGLSGDAPDAPDVPEPTVEVVNDNVPGAVGDSGGRAAGAAGRAGEGEAEGVPTQEARGPVEVRVTVAEQKARLTGLWNADTAVVQAQESTWERRFTKLFARQAASSLKRLEEGSPRRQRALAEGRAPADEVFDRRFWEAQTVDMSADLYESLARVAHALVNDRMGVSFDLMNEDALAFIEARADQLAGQVTATTYDAIKAAMAEGAEAGEGIPDLAARIRHVFDVASSQRSTVIARTEVISGFNAATAAGLTSLPADVCAGLEWVATADGRTRKSHATANGQAVYIGMPFQVGASQMFYPGDPNGAAKETVQCRCTVAGLTPEALAEKQQMMVEALATSSVPVDRARVALAMVQPGEFDEARFRRALEAA